jgi:hypothetical protein
MQAPEIFTIQMHRTIVDPEERESRLARFYSIIEQYHMTDATAIESSNSGIEMRSSDIVQPAKPRLLRKGHRKLNTGAAYTG